jgi:hypothetical protein
MRSLFDELQRREAAARPEAEELRGRIAQLAERLAGAEERLSRLVIARELFDEVLGGGASAEVLRCAVDGDTAWTEWEHRATRPDGSGEMQKG